jgi:hypothetical protein
LDASSPARKKKKPAAPRDRAAAQEPLAIVEVPPDSAIYEKALLLLQPMWVRLGGHVVVWVVLFSVLMYAGERWPDIPDRVLGFMGAAAGGVLSSILWGLRRHALRRQVDRWLRHASQAGGSRIEINEDGLVCGGAIVLWSEVSDAAELDSAEAMLLAVQARGSWIILPASCFTRGDFRGAQSLLMRKLGDKLRVVLQ